MNTILLEVEITLMVSIQVVVAVNLPLLKVAKMGTKKVSCWHEGGVTVWKGVSLDIGSSTGIVEHFPRGISKAFVDTYFTSE